MFTFKAVWKKDDKVGNWIQFKFCEYISHLSQQAKMTQILLPVLAQKIIKIKISRRTEDHFKYELCS